MKALQVGLLGFGTVGRGTWDVLRRNAEEITRRAGRPIRITWIGTRTLERARAGARGITDVQFTADPTALADCGHMCHVAVQAKDYIFHPRQKR